MDYYLIEQHKKLWLSVIEQAFDDVLVNIYIREDDNEDRIQKRNAKITLRKQSFQWIMSNSTKKFSSFLNLCNLFDLDHKYLRESLLLKIKEKNIKI